MVERRGLRGVRSETRRDSLIGSTAPRPVPSPNGAQLQEGPLHSHVSPLGLAVTPTRAHVAVLTRPCRPPPPAPPDERSPLLSSSDATTPRRTLNPRAASFRLDQHSDAGGVERKRPQAAIAPSAVALAAAPAQPEALPSNALSTDLGRHSAGQSAAASPTTSTLHPHFVPSSSSLNGDDDDGTTRDHTARPGSPTSSQSSFSSSLSSDDYLPTLRTFQRLHLVQFALTLLLLFVLPVVIVVVLAHQLRWEAFLLGARAGSRASNSARSSLSSSRPRVPRAHRR